MTPVGPSRVMRSGCKCGLRWIRAVGAVEVSVAPRANDGPRRKPLEVKKDGPRSPVAGYHVLPKCRWCAGPLVFRGSWQCDGCSSRHALGPEHDLCELPDRLPVEAYAGVPLERRSDGRRSQARIFSPREGHKSTSLRKKASEDWDALEMLTSYSRRSRRDRLLARGATPTPDGGVALRHWYAQRINALDERASRWRACGELMFMAELEGKTVPVERRCGDWRACPRCKEHRRFKLQRDAGRMKEAAERLYSVEMGRYYAGSEGRWSEKMVTLTVPHTGDPHEDKRLMRGAMKRFERSLNDYLRARGVRKKAKKSSNLSLFPWLRAYEVGFTNSIHFHCHIWMLAPFVEQALLHVWWGDALLAENLPRELMPFVSWAETGARDAESHAWADWRDEVPWPVADIRRAKNTNYTSKVGLNAYVVKTDGSVTDLAPAHVAMAYELLSDMRVVHFGMGWAPNRAAQGWHMRRATRAEHKEWCARFAANAAPAPVFNELPLEAGLLATTGTDASPATGPPETPKAPQSPGRDGRASQLFLFGDNH